MTSSRALLKTDLDPAWLLRIFTIIPVLLILLAGAGALWMYFFVSSLLPEGESVVDAIGLAGEVRVVRDANGVPGIMAEKEEDLPLVLGYVMAQDRLWQMDYLRRVGDGRLSEILGSGYIDSDHLMRAVRAGKIGEQRVEPLDGPARVWAERFVQGVNRYILGHGNKPPVEFSLLEYRPGQFAVEDILSICYAVAWYSSRAAQVDPVMAGLLARLGKDRGIGLVPTDPAVFPGLVVADLLDWEPSGLLFPAAGVSRGLPAFPGLTGGSLWAVGSEKSRSGRPLLSSMVHQTLVAPGFWYQARLVAGDFHLTGAFIPGVPAAFAGTNGHTSWGCVPAAVDDADLYVEQLDADTPSRVWKVDRWKTITQSREGYRLRRGSTETRTVWLTGTGPIVSDVHRGRAFSLRWTAAEGTGLFPMLYSLNRSQGGEDVRAALGLLVAPGMNVVWGDSDGNYGIRLAGKIPIRPPESDGVVPMPGWTGVHDWRGFIPFDELPSVTNPSGGVTVVADGRPGGPLYPYLVSCYWRDELLTGSIRNLLAQEGPHHRDTFQSIQNDTRSPLAAELTPLLVKAAASHGTKSREEQEAVKLLDAWDFTMNRESAAAAVFGLSYHALVEDLLASSLGDRLFADYAGDFSLTAGLVRKIFLHHQKVWPTRGDPQQMLADSLRRGVSRGRSLMGSEPGKWKWADLHRLVFRHPIAARSRFLEGLYHVGPIAVSGSADTVNYSGWSPAHPYRATTGVSLRQIADMTGPPQMFASTALGSSAHFFSTHYKSQTRAWADGKTFLEPIHVADIRKAGGNSVLFRPSRVGPISQR